MLSSFLYFYFIKNKNIFFIIYIALINFILVLFNFSISTVATFLILIF